MLVLVLFAGTWAIVGIQARAQPVFKKYFDQRYFPVDRETAMKTAYKSSTCTFCHVGAPAPGAARNEYGKTLAKVINKKDAEALSFKSKLESPDLYRKTEEKVRRALEWAETQPSNPRLEDSPSFGDLIKSGRLPK
jgi:hypothetical protein